MSSKPIFLLTNARTHTATQRQLTGAICVQLHHSQLERANMVASGSFCLPHQIAPGHQRHPSHPVHLAPATSCRNFDPISTVSSSLLLKLAARIDRLSKWLKNVNRPAGPGVQSPRASWALDTR